VPGGKIGQKSARWKKAGFLTFDTCGYANAYPQHMNPRSRLDHLVSLLNRSTSEVDFAQIVRPIMVFRMLSKLPLLYPAHVNAGLPPSL